MTRLILFRLGSAAATLFALLVLSFVFLRFAPGGPFDSERPLPPEVRRAVEEKYGLTRPLWIDWEAARRFDPKEALSDTQLGRYLGGLARLDLGPSLKLRGWRVSEVIAASLPYSLLLGTLAFALAFAGAVVGSAICARRGGAAQAALRWATVAGLALPGYLLGGLLLLVFGFALRLVPVAGWGGPSHLLLPLLTLAAPTAAVLAGLASDAFDGALGSEPLRAARARGLSEGRLLFRHALPLAIGPLLSYSGPAAAAMLTGSVVVERIFALPGLGSHFVSAAFNRDYPLVMGTVLVYGALLLAFNLATDLLQAVIDPRLREGAAR